MKIQNKTHKNERIFSLPKDNFKINLHLITTMNMSDCGVKIGIKADTGIMLLKSSTVSAVVNVVGS
jgi:hypothetical protein